MSKPILVLGAGGHAAVIVDMLQQLHCNIVGLVEKDPTGSHSVFEGLTRYLSDEDILTFDKDSVILANGIGSLPGQNARFEIHKKFKSLGYSFMTLVSPLAVISAHAVLSEGVQVLPGAIINANSKIGEGTIINSGAIVEHDCNIGRYNHVAPGAVLCGNVKTGSYCHIGSHATVIQGVQVVEECVIGAGAVLTKSITEAGSILYPARNVLINRRSSR